MNVSCLDFETHLLIRSTQQIKIITEVSGNCNDNCNCNNYGNKKTTINTIVNKNNSNGNSNGHENNDNNTITMRFNNTTIKI